jgi:hypothetical protein
MPQLVTQADLARRWGVSTARVAQLTTKDGFPEAKQRVGARDQALYSLIGVVLTVILAELLITTGHVR